MSKRYAYYRTSDGRPYRGTDGKCAPNHILSEIGKTASVDANGQVSWPEIDAITKFRVALRYAFSVVGLDGAELNETDTWHIAWQAIVASVKSAPSKPVDPVKLIGRINDSAAKFFRAPLAKYVLVSSLSIAELPAKRIKVRDCVVASLKERGKRFPLPEALSAPVHRSAISNHIENTKYRLVRVSVKGRSIHDAADRALNSLHLLRALWSLSTARGGFWHMLGWIPSGEPLGVIHIGPIHTLHLPDGKLAADNLYWCEPDFTEDQAIFRNAKGWTEIEGIRRRAMKRLGALQYRSEMEALLIRYVRALDQLDMDVAFLQMWSILEKITGTIGANYDKTIKRTIWPLPEETRHSDQDILQLIRCRRNQYVHSGRTSDASEQAAYLIKSFVEPHIRILLLNVLGVRSLEEYAAFLSLPTKRNMLLGRKQRLAKAIRILYPE